MCTCMNVIMYKCVWARASLFELSVYECLSVCMTVTMCVFVCMCTHGS